MSSFLRLCLASLLCLVATSSPAQGQDLSELLNAPLEGAAANGQDPNPPAASGEGFSMNQEGGLEFHARNLDIHEVFQQLRTLTRTNIVVDASVKATFSGDLYDLSIDEAVEMICLSTGLSSTRKGSYLFIEETQMLTRVFVLHHSRAEDIKELIESMLGENEKVTASAASEVGIGSDDEGSGGDAYASSDVVFVRAMPENMTEIELMINEVDVPPKQVMIEATILTADMIYSKQLGVDISALQSLNFNDVNASSNGFSLNYGDLTADQMANSAHTLGTDFAGDVADGGLNFGFFRGSVAGFVRALQEVTNAQVLAQPKVMALNKQKGEVLLGRRDGYLTTTVTETGTTQQVEYLETGTRLLFRPFVGENGLIRLEVHPEDSEGGLNSLGLPFETTAELTTNILVKSGQTVLIGGLYREKDRTVEKGVPGAKDVPIFGNLFGSDEDTINREEVLVLLTPTLIDADTYGEEFASTDPVAVGEGADGRSALLGNMYLRTAKALALEGSYGSAMILLQDSGKADDNDAEARGVRERVQKGLVPPSSGATVDQRILDDLLQGTGP
jgi:type IV pilus assembly protein PilQ